MPTGTTRLAPSPTGALHLGNARTFLVNWAVARRAGWRVVLRIEDLDGPRVRRGADVAAIEDLAWLGLDWDGPATYQRADLAPYRAALSELRAKGLVYACRCTRSQVAAAQSAPHGDDHELRYPGTCRPMGPPTGVAVQRDAGAEPAAWRLLVPDGPVGFEDRLHGTQSVDVQGQVGDFIVATKAGLPAYQLAVVVDDARQGVTEVIRGDDLLPSTARQVLLYRCLGLAPLPRYTHLPLVLGPDGRRLAKRHGDSRLATYRSRGVRPQRIVGLIAAWSGLIARPRPMAAAEFREGFTLERLPRAPVTFSHEDHQWLLSR